MATVRGGSSLSAPWLRTLRLLAAAILILTLLGPPGSRPASAATNTYYFHGPATAPFFDTNAPSGSVPQTQTSTPLANQDFAGNSLAAWWKGSVCGWR